ncbi:threonine aldolase [Capronia epimyces CBS 606.96]|uniref:Threonine aldolase n=1 Tax=Capronia epimyces CBS 606.96 TaxID=1182542 RepID=W9XTS1_9EURO|nr:threonine aldolase [Capronia epimyces CBS 606.96]EXJ83937.1 threonine aldolase [Capronia epimyces CBS 606.96]
MSKYNFLDDYSEGAHPRIIEALARTNMTQQTAYGNDEFSQDAREAIRNKIGADEATIHFVPSGTAANLLSIASCLRPHEAIIAASSAHIVMKETAAIEATGHKIITQPAVDGKLTPDKIRLAFDQNSIFAHQAKPKMVYISNATEIGTVYTRSELAAIAAICKSLDLLILMDGARLGAALASSETDMTLNDIYHLTDLFWIGGTKTGALIGEAVVIKDKSLGADFPYHMKQRGALLAKGRILGIQFSTLLQDDLFLHLARHANSTAAEISSSLVKMGFNLWAKTETNQVFPILPSALVQELQKEFDFYIWDRLCDGSLVVRVVTSWATELSKVRRFITMAEEWKAGSQEIAVLEKQKPVV